jgi:hypothetical protein
MSQQVTKGGHNSRVIDSNADQPRTLSAAEEKFRAFLVTQNYPTAISWLMPGDLVAGKNRHFWVKKRGVEATKYAILRYSLALERNVGVELAAICATEKETFASVFVPEVDLDAERHLMGRGLKLTCPVKARNVSRYRWLKWKLLWWWNTRRSRLKNGLESPNS